MFDMPLLAAGGCPARLKTAAFRVAQQPDVLLLRELQIQTDTTHISAKKIHFKGERLLHNSGLLMAYGRFSLSHNNIVAISSSRSALKYIQHVACIPCEYHTATNPTAFLHCYVRRIYGCHY